MTMTTDSPPALYSQDGRWRITVTPGGAKYEVEYDGHPVLTFTDVHELEIWLNVFGVYLADLTEDNKPTS